MRIIIGRNLLLLCCAIGIMLQSCEGSKKGTGNNSPKDTIGVAWVSDSLTSDSQTVEKQSMANSLAHADSVKVSSLDSVQELSENHKEGESLAKDSPIEVKKSEEGCYLKASFISKGSGIDRIAKKEFDTFLKSYEKEHDLKVDYSSRPWGREGERDYCFTLENMKDFQRRNFVQAAKTQLQGLELVLISAE